MAIPLKFVSDLDDSSFMRGVKRMEEQGKGLAKTFGTIGGGAALGLGTALVAGTKALIDFGSNLRDAIDSTDMAAESFQKLSFSFGQSGSSQETFVRGIQTLTLKMQDAKDGNEATIKSFARLGISLEDLNRNDSGEVLKMIADGTKNAVNPSQTLAASLDVLGKAGKAMQAGLKEGADGLEALSKGMQTLSDDDLNQLDKAGDAIDSLVNRVKVAEARGLLGLGTLIRSIGGSGELDSSTGPATYADDLKSRQQADERIAKKQIDQKEQEIKEIAAMDEARDVARMKRRDEAEKSAYKARAKEFQRIDQEQSKENENRAKLEAQQEYDHKKWIADEAKRAQEIEHDRIMKNLEAQKVFAEEAKERHLSMLESWLGNEQNKLAAAKQKHQAAKDAADGALQAGIRGGLQTAAERRAEAMAEKRVAREERRLERILANPDKKIGGKTGDAQRAKELRDARNVVNLAAKEVTLAESSVTALAAAIDKLIVKP